MWAACGALSDGSMMPSVTTALNLKQATCCMHPCKPAVLLRPHRRPDRVRGVLGVPLGGEEAACLPCALAACAAPLGTLQAYRVITSHMCQLASPSAAPLLLSSPAPLLRVSSPPLATAKSPWTGSSRTTLLPSSPRPMPTTRRSAPADAPTRHHESFLSCLLTLDDFSN